MATNSTGQLMYRSVVGYLGTIEMPEDSSSQSSPSSGVSGGGLSASGSHSNSNNSAAARLAAIRWDRVGDTWPIRFLFRPFNVGRLLLPFVWLSFLQELRASAQGGKEGSHVGAPPRVGTPTRWIGRRRSRSLQFLVDFFTFFVGEDHLDQPGRR